VEQVEKVEEVEAVGNVSPRRVLLVATTTGYQIRSFGEAAGKLGVRLIFASDRCDRLDDPWWDQAIPVRFHDEGQAVEAVVAACAGVAPDGIIAVGDRPAILAAHLARVFGLVGHPPDSATTSRNKLLSRRALRAAGLPTPWFESMSIDTDPRSVADRIHYPAVVKPLALSGSRGVMRVDNAEQCVAAFHRLRTLLKSSDVQIERDEAHREVLVESFIPGAEYAVEGILEHGAFRPLAIFDKPDLLDGPFFEETIYVTPSVAPADVQHRILAGVADAARAIGLHHGPIHAECRVAGTTVHVLEVAARPIGGLCGRSLRFVRDGHVDPVTFEELLLRHALGESIDTWRREPVASGVMMIPIPKRGVYRGVQGVDEARAVAGVEDVQITVKPEARVVPLPEGKSYLGFIFARGADSLAVEAALRHAHQRLHFLIERELTVVA
jgi:formate-dependent phosphoribosylglycinamide formyltransferase (GAR transformylase)